MKIFLVVIIPIVLIVFILYKIGVGVTAAKAKIEKSLEQQKLKNNKFKRFKKAPKIQCQKK